MRQRALHATITIVSLLILVLPLVFAVVKIVKDPEVPFLLSEGGAEWIQIKRPFSLRSWRGDEGIRYRIRIVTEKALPEAVLTVRALRTAEVYLDERLVLPFNFIEDWKYPRSVDLKDYLTPGPHELIIIALNENGPAVLLAYSKTLDIHTGKNWEASIDGSTWGPVKQVDERGPLELANKFPSAVTAFYSLVPFYFPLFLVCFFVLLSSGMFLRQYPGLRNIVNNPRMCRWVVMGAWLLLAVNNIAKIPLVIGFDAPDHYDYISYVAEKGAVPLATEGWQMFQSPLYYLISALFQMCLKVFFSAEKVQILLRIIPLICGMLQAELAYRAVKYVFPERNDLQMMGTLIGGFIPMNFYLSQVVGNEPLAGVLSATAIVLTLGIIRSTGPLPERRFVYVGTALGLAFLTKFTAILLIPPVLLALLFVMVRNEEPFRRIAGRLLAVLGIIAIISGWYYLRNWLELGKPFIGGWDTSRKIIWWQEPGYRTIFDLIVFGRSLSTPMYSAIYGFWDSIYSTFWLDGFIGAVAYEFRPRWNYDFMLSGTLLSLLPAAGIIIGFVKTVSRPKSSYPAWIFSAYCIAVYFAALLYLYVTVPIYSTAKATYTIGLIPCYTVLCVTGLDFLERNRYLGAAVKSLLICWAFTAYFSYFVL